MRRRSTKLTRPPLRIGLVALAVATSFACRTPEDLEEGEVRSLQTIGLRHHDILLVAEAVTQDVAEAVSDEPSPVVLLDLRNESTLPQGSWGALSGSLVNEIVASARGKPYVLTTEPGAGATHRLALAVSETGALDDRELFVRYGVVRAATADGPEEVLAEAERSLRSRR